MEIKYLGCSSFLIKDKIEDSEVKLLIDPFDNTHTSYKIAKQVTDIVTVSHQHEDHNNLDMLENNDYFLAETPGEYEVKFLKFYGYKSYHDESNGKERGGNTIFVYDFPTAKICHLGDLGHVLSGDFDADLSDIDILMIPVGGHYTLPVKKIKEVIDAIDPRIVIPMHYKTDKQYADSELITVDEFLSKIGVQRETVDTLKIKTINDYTA
ncbi:MAG: MBL fold metallo-hydrolase, partial [Romboutsia sp.]|nr:MBL fold metallo-hydrolase [Romboutsia sp.]